MEKEIKTLKKENKKLRDALYDQEHEIQQLHIECNDQKRRIINLTARVKIGDEHYRQLQEMSMYANELSDKCKELNNRHIKYMIIIIIINVISIIAIYL